MKASPARRVALCGLLFALALALGFAESTLTPLLGLPPGVKPGLANIVVVFALLFLSRGAAALLVLLKAAFALFTRGAIAGLLSLCGGGLALLAMVLLLLPRRRPGLALLSVCGAICHNLGQLLVVRFLFGPAMLYYLPVLLLSGIGMGLLTAVLLKALLPALQKAGLCAPQPPRTPPAPQQTEDPHAD